MRLRDTLRHAAEETKEAAQRGMDSMRERLEDAESAMRRRMRIHPSTTPKMSSHPEAEDAAATSLAQGVDMQPIVSIHGRDVSNDKNKRAA